MIKKKIEKFIEDEIALEKKINDRKRKIDDEKYKEVNKKPRIDSGKRKPKSKSKSKKYKKRKSKSKRKNKKT